MKLYRFIVIFMSGMLFQQNIVAVFPVEEGFEPIFLYCLLALVLALSMFYMENTKELD